MKKHLILVLAVASLTVLASCEKENGTTDTNPRITINENETALPPTGGTASISYEIVNPVENGELKAEPSVTWMSGFKVSETRISFAVEANSTGASRPGIIKLTYTYEDSLSTTLDVNVTQESMQEGDVATPIIEFNEDPVNLPSVGGNGEITYTVVNPVTGATVTAELDDHTIDWLSGFNCDTYGVITFDVALNESIESRSAVLNITYNYGTQSLFEQVSVVQAGVSSYDSQMTYMYLKNTGAVSTRDSYNFMLKLSELPIDEYGNLDNKGTGYQLDLYSKDNNAAPTAGTYTVDMNNSTDPETIGYYSSFAIIDGKSITFTGGSITISYEGDNISITGTLTDVNYSIHNISYTGVLEDEEEDEGISCLTEDYTLDLSTATATYKYIGDLPPGWQFEFIPEGGEGDGIFIELYATAADGAKFPTGTFNEAPDIWSSTGFYPGKVSYGMPQGTMYYKYANGWKSGEWAPAITGELTIADNGDDTHTFTFSFVDDEGHTWSGTWTGTVWEAM